MLINQKPNIMNCPNCEKKLTCGCQKRIASDKKQVCANCLENYEAKLKIAKITDSVKPNT